MPIALSHSAIKSFRRCKRQFYYKYVEGLESRMPGQPLKLGSWIHELMEAHYTKGNWETRHKSLTRQFNSLTIDEREFYGDLPTKAKKLMAAYEYHWRHEEDNWEILHVEQRFAVEAADGSTLSFKPDLIVREKDSGLIGVWDHKSTTSLPSAEWRIQDLQSVIYPWGLELAGIKVDYFGWNYLRTKEPTIPHTNQDGALSKRKLDTEYHTLATFLIRHFGDKTRIPQYWRVILKSLKGQSNYFKRTRMVKDTVLINRMIAELDWTTQEIQAWVEFMDNNPADDPWVRTVDRDCEWHCDFFDLCQVELLGGDGKFLRKSKYRPSTYSEELVILGNN